MRPNSSRPRLRGVEFKAQVLVECWQTGASAAAIALAHGLNVSLVRIRLVGRRREHAGLAARRPFAATAPGFWRVPVELAEARVIEPAQ